jgi:formylglycine-generating enzyme required for sulfatase activity
MWTKRTVLITTGIAVALAMLGTPRPAASGDADALPQVMRNPKDGAELVLVPGGAYRAENIHLEQPVTRRIESYYLYRYLVTISQYRKFCTDTGHAAPTQPEWKDRDGLLKLFPERWFQGESFAPVSNVSWSDAQAYCRWAGVSLSTDGQWERAAWGAGGEGRASAAEDLVIPLRQWCEFNPEDRATSKLLKPPAGDDLRSIRGTYGPFDPNPHEHSSLGRGLNARGMSFRGARTVRL